MNKLKVLIFIIISVFIISSCSKKPVDKLVGIWKVQLPVDTTTKAKVDLTYEFTKDKIISAGTVHGEPLDTVIMPFVYKSTISDTMILEATHPKSQQKGDFKIILQGNKMTMIDPGPNVWILEKQ